jgi:thiamine-phosphate pyrophosphorylase
MLPYTYSVRRYAITDRSLFPADEPRVPHVPPLGHGFPPPSEQLPTQHPSFLQPIDKVRVPHPSQPHREGWDVQLSALLHQTALWAADGIDYIQLREKDLPASTLAALARRILETLRDTPTRLLINSRADIAIATTAHGVHLTGAPGQLTPAQVRELYATATLPPPIVSVSCHTLAEVEHARHHADLILFAPVFQKSVAGKLVTPGQGLEALRAAVFAAGPTPVYALGGITPDNTSDCLAAGAAGVAGIQLFRTLFRDNSRSKS